MRKWTGPDWLWDECRSGPYKLRVPKQPKGPVIVCLCGSTRFYQAFQDANYRETMMGKIVLTVGFYPHATQEAHGEKTGISPE